MAALDNTRDIETPEGIVLRLSVAGPVPRALAWALDLLLRGILYAVAASLFGMLFGASGMLGPFFIFLFLVEWFYPVVFEVLRDGQTPGKRSLGLRVLHDDGTPMRWSTSMIRNLLLVVDFLPFLYAFGLASMLLSRDLRRLGDLAAGTVVTHVSDSRPPLARIEARPVRPPVELSSEEQQLLLDFAARRGQISPERVRELAQTVAPLTGEQAEPEAALLGWAAWVAGSGKG
ncbi:MAG: RDD family protein [Gammaproteobacteria bacterium]|nr:MAG: RDD family protein [Gammaproteobacteria bacterium]